MTDNMHIFKPIFAVFSLIRNLFRIKKAIKLIHKTAERIEKKYQKYKIKQEKLARKGYPRLKRLPKLQKHKQASYNK